jgi:hypothetical protein
VSAGKVILLVFGIIVLVVGLAMATGGGGALWANAALTDDEGYFATKTLRIDRSSHAVVSEPTDIDVGSAWVWDWGDLATFKVEASNDNPSKNVFVGVADDGDLSDYLRDVNYDEVSDLEIRPDRLEYRNRPGSSEPAAPTTQGFWLESVNGSGTQLLEWELQSGSWSLVLMNEDGSAGLDLSVVLGVKISWLVGAAIGVLAGGIVTLLLGVLMIILAVRKRQTPQRPRISEPGPRATEEPPAPASAAVVEPPTPASAAVVEPPAPASTTVAEPPAPASTTVAEPPTPASATVPEENTAEVKASTPETEESATEPKEEGLS